MKKDPKTGKMMPAFMKKKNGAKNGNGKNGMKNGNGKLTAAQKKLPKALQAAILKKKKKK